MIPGFDGECRMSVWVWVSLVVVFLLLLAMGLCCWRVETVHQHDGCHRQGILCCQMLVQRLSNNLMDVSSPLLSIQNIKKLFLIW